MPRARLLLISWWTVRLVAGAYPFALLAVIAAFRLIGDGWWPVVAALYLPRWGFAIPLPFLAVALAFGRRWRLLALQVVTFALLVFPLMGLRLSRARAPIAGRPSFKVVTFNVDSARAGLAKVVAHVRAADPDLIVIQEARNAGVEPWRAGLPGYNVDKSGQFVLASRFPIEERFEPPSVVSDGRSRTARFARYRIAVPGGPLQVYSVHPISPRESLDELRGDGLRHEIMSGRILRPASDDVMSAAALRGDQLAAVVADAARSPYPVIIAGDTNLPGLSRTLALVFPAYHDAFEEVGFGFGYTFPNRPGGPWMRIDRIFAGPRLRFLDCRVIGGAASDHRPVIATIEIASP